jgi:small subunit ribosomal protein S16
VAVKIRLMRVGKKKQPTYRVVVADSRSPRDGRFIEILGQYAPRQEPSVVQVDSDRAVHWLREGAQPTEQVAKILEVAGIWDAYKSATGKDAVAKPKPKTPEPKQPKPAAEPEATAPAAADAADAAAGDGETGGDAAEATESG